MTTAFVSTYPPQRCGIATFTADLAAAVDSRCIVSLPPAEASIGELAEVRHRIRRDIPADYTSAARWLDQRGVDVVSVQHEYGIWGGPDGALVLDLVHALSAPVVATLHTVLATPTPSQRRILVELVKATSAAVVMSSSAADLLTRSYGIDQSHVEVIPHGVPDLPFVDPGSVKPRFGVAGRTVILSFGLLGPGKGYESAIAAMPAVVEADPTALYVIVGATHPELLRREGEAYRQRLLALATSLGVLDHVRFVGRFVGSEELGAWLMAADIFVTPYPNLDQIVSGTLSYAMGAGKAIVSTPYAYAQERLAEGRGRLVDAGSTPALGDAISELAGDPELRESIGRRAYAYSRGMRWPQVGEAYGRVFDRVSRREPMTIPVAVPTATTAASAALARA